MDNKVILIVMDGWGHGAVNETDAIKNAATPFVDSLYNSYPNTELVTHGKEVGLPQGQMGNSEVGHLNLGAGRVVYQELERINVSIETGELADNLVLQNVINYALENNKPLHLMGLVSDGGVHSHLDHIKEICNICKAAGVNKLFTHAFTDGRDTDPKSGIRFMEDLMKHHEKTVGDVASVTGRFYAMDRDKRWERVKVAYDNLVHGKGRKSENPLQAINESYAEGMTDEFIKPITICNKDGNPKAIIQEGDAVLCFNFRTDRCRQITEALSQKDFPEQQMQKLNLHYTTMTEYDKSFEGINVLFKKNDLKNTLGEVLEKNGKTQIRIAETEKYPHVTFFFSGGREKEFEGEKRILKPSPKEVATYDLKPEMSAFELTEALLPEIKKGQTDFICLNFANTDMVGHTGVWDAAMKAAETVDQCVSQLVSAALEQEYAIFLTADHGNSDCLRNEDGSPNTAHTLNPVPLFFISNEKGIKIKPGKLGDIAPSILNYMGIEIPEEMTGDNLLN
jgi:2,3-bisphosphoglycerate-independent phosphoglycerate mutase